MEKEETVDKKRHNNRQDLAGEHALGDLGQLIKVRILAGKLKYIE